MVEGSTEKFIVISAFQTGEWSGHYKRMPRALVSGFLSLGASSEIFDVSDPSVGLSGNVVSALQNPFGLLSERSVSDTVNSLIQQIIQRQGSDEAAFFVYEGSLLWIEILGRVAKELPRATFMVNLMNGFALDSLCKAVPKQLGILEDALREWSQIPNLFVTVENPILQNQMFERSGILFPTFPVFSTEPIEPAYPKSGSLIFVSGLGKRLGTEIVLSAAKLAEKPVRVFPGRSLDSIELAKDLEARIQEIDYVSIIEDHLSAEEYSRLFRNASEVWFLYFAKFNFFGSSGKVLDALNGGALPIVPDGSALQASLGELSKRFGVFSLGKRNGALILDRKKAVGISQEKLDGTWAATRLKALFHEHSTGKGSKVTHEKKRLKHVWVLTFITRLHIRLLALFRQNPAIVDPTKFWN